MTVNGACSLTALARIDPYLCLGARTLDMHQALYEKAIRETRVTALAQIEAARLKRVQERLTKAIKFTQVGVQR